MRDDGKTILEAAFSVLNTSGKYREDGTYEGTSLGSFGIGSKITTFLSHWLTVSTYRDGKCEWIKFEEGIFNDREVRKDNSLTGTEVCWLPSEEFFTHPEVEIEKVNVGFMAVLAKAGNNTIEFKYQTPGLKNGIIISIISLFLFAAYMVISHLVSKNKEPKLCYPEGDKLLEKWQSEEQEDNTTIESLLEKDFWSKIEDEKKETATEIKDEDLGFKKGFFVDFDFLDQENNKKEDN
jgi:hypothetical protein